MTFVGLRKEADESGNKIKELKQELCCSSYEIERIAEDNQHLTATITKLTNHIEQLHQNLHLRKQRIKDLKRKIHHYISEVRRVEEAIESKEQDLQRILEIYKVEIDEETFMLGNKQHETEEVDRNSVTEYLEKFKFELNSLETIENKVD